MIQPQNTYRCEVMSWVKENCLSLAGLLKYLSARKKLNLFIFIKAKELQQRRRGELIGENIKKRKEKYFPLLSAERIYQHVHLGKAAVICNRQHCLKSSFWSSHFVQSFPFNNNFFHLFYDELLMRTIEKGAAALCLSEAREKKTKTLNVKRKTNTRSLPAHMLHYLLF